MTLSHSKIPKGTVHSFGSHSPLCDKAHQSANNSTLQRRIHHLTHREKSFYHRCSCALRPFRVLLGTGALASSVVVVFAVFLSNMDKVANAVCGHGCGWMLDHPRAYNPLNVAFLWAAQVSVVSWVLFFGVSLLDVGRFWLSEADWLRVWNASGGRFLVRREGGWSGSSWMKFGMGSGCEAVALPGVVRVGRTIHMLVESGVRMYCRIE